ncbi:MAG: MotA/TolQ/ExbB proton channel family protein [Ignavibacteriaceae bacterium]|nr:MotA/TolQ/ExbB proton channel family protein [Ignavibacteriaceae bacterium]HRI48365.1 MotA/TolQ/ExbB proton channel family protein [Ignavibacteriaceae bacterium]
MDLLAIFLKGGFLMWPILLLSIIGFAVAIDRYIVIRKAKINAPSFLIKIRGLLRKKDVSGAVAYCMEERSPAANIVRKALKKHKLGHERVKEAIENAGKQEIVKLEKGLSILATVSGVAPLLGFLGTVTGMISAFMRIEDLQGAANPSDLAGGIWEALITTAFGLGVGILATMFYNYFLGAVTKLVHDMEVISTDVLDTLQEVTSGAKDDDDLEIEL